MKTENMATPYAWRLVCAAEEDATVRVLSRRRVQMIVPPDDDLAGAPGAAGCWAELRDAEARPLYRRILRDPWARDQGRRGERRAFSVLVPDVEGAADVALLRAGRPAAAGGPGVEELAFLALGGPT